MNFFRSKPRAEPPLNSRRLLRNWQSTSFRSGWRVRSDWMQPEVRSAVISLSRRSRVPDSTARSLGAARARNGVGIGETMTDFRALFAAAQRRLDLDALQSLAEGWAEETVPASALSCTDVYTGLATTAHFQRTIHDLYALDPAETAQFGIAVIVLRRPEDAGSHPWTVLATVGDEVARFLDGSGAIAMYRNCAVHVLVRRSDDWPARMDECQNRLDCLAGGLLGPTRLKWFPLPESAKEVEDLLAAAPGEILIYDVPRHRPQLPDTQQG